MVGCSLSECDVWVVVDGKRRNRRVVKRRIEYEGNLPNVVIGVGSKTYVRTDGDPDGTPTYVPIELKNAWDAADEEAAAQEAEAEHV